jgi:hypothetical protein
LKFDWERVTARTANVLDYTFTGAPADWRAGKGRWEVSERWTCSPQWGFFGGSGSVNPTLWSRFALRGDFVLEAYLATPMDMTRGERSPMDLNLTIGGDGRDLASGYSFMFGAKGRTINRLLRGDAVASEKRFIMPKGQGSAHQDWFYVRLERRQTPQGLLLRYSVNGQEIWNYTDPNPLAGALHEPGRIAFWSYNGGLSIARVRLWHSGLENDERDSGSRVADSEHSTPTVKNALGEWRPRTEGTTIATARVSLANEGERRALQVVNPQSGGDWTLYVTRQPFDAKERPVLQFNYRVPSNVLVNLYAKVAGTWHEIAFTAGPSQPAARSGKNTPAETKLGRIEDVSADNKWHAASFELLTALRNAKLDTRVEALAFAAPDHEYLRAGIGGNHLGATYWLSDFEAPLTSTGTVARLDQ